MKISTILDHIDSGHMALPEFQRGYVWNRDQVRGLFNSLYRRHPVGGLLVWATEGIAKTQRGDAPVAQGIIKLLLDGQQRMTSLYGVVRGKPPEFFDGNERTFSGLRFHIADESFAFYQPVKMRDDPLWIDVTSLMRNGYGGLGETITKLQSNPESSARLGEFSSRLTRLLGIQDVDLHIDEVTGSDKTVDVVVDIFNRVNSGGTKLSKGDLALAKICAEWPEARTTMKGKIAEWRESGYNFSIDWLLRSVNTVLTGEAKFSYLHGRDAADVQHGLERAGRHIDTSLNLISGRLGLDHDRVLFGRFALPVMVRYLEQTGGVHDAKTRDKLLFWFVQAGMWGRFSGSTETVIDQDLATLEETQGNLDGLLERLRLGHGSLRVEASHFTGWSLGARFYPVLYMLTRMGDARDWGTGLPLKANMLGKMNRLEVHHIFPKSKLYELGFARPQVNALANFCFLTKDTNLNISNRLPEDYFPEVEANQPGALASQWIPGDAELWTVDRYAEFLEARKALLAEEANRCFEDLLYGDIRWLTGAAATAPLEMPTPVGGIGSEAEEQELTALNDWVAAQGLPRGQIEFDYADPGTGTQKAVFDLAWPDGLQRGLSSSVAVLLNEPPEVLSLASAAGFRCFTAVHDFRRYVETEILKEEAA